LQGTETTHRHELKKGCNTVFKTFEGPLFVRSECEVLEAAEDSQQGPEKLATIGRLFSVGYYQHDCLIFLAIIQQNFARTFHYVDSIIKFLHIIPFGHRAAAFKNELLPSTRH
jgi:hypothetical protein